MTSEQIQLVRSSWARILPIKEAAAELFYARLFNRYPEVRPYFKGGLMEQGQKLFTMIDVAVQGIDRLDALQDSLRQAGKRHREYGVKQEDFPKVADSLLWTLKKGLGDDYTDEVEEAWSATYQRVAAIMAEGVDR